MTGQVSLTESSSQTINAEHPYDMIQALIVDRGTSFTRLRPRTTLQSLQQSWLCRYNCPDLFNPFHLNLDKLHPLATSCTPTSWLWPHFTPTRYPLRPTHHHSAFITTSTASRSCMRTLLANRCINHSNTFNGFLKPDLLYPRGYDLSCTPLCLLSLPLAAFLPHGPHGPITMELACIL